MESKKNNVFVSILFVIVCLLMVPGAVFAHHSYSIWDRDQLVSVTGTVTQFEIINPHTQLHLDVKNEKGNVEHWVATSGNALGMHRSGWTSDLFKPGDQITISGFRLKDGRPVILQIRTIMANGKLAPFYDEQYHFLEQYLERHPEAKDQLPKERVK